MKTKFFFFVLIMALVSCLGTAGVYATWHYSAGSVNYKDINFGTSMSEYAWVPPSTASTVVYITQVEQKSGDGSAFINGYGGTYLSSSTTLTGMYNSSVTLSITVYNSSTTDDYAFNAIKYIPEQYDNNDILHTLPDLERGDRINSGEYLTFDVVFSYVSGSSRNDTILNSVLNFEFIVAEELPEEEEIAVSGALEQFKNIINNVVREGSFDELIDQMNDYSDNDRHNNSYIGNVNGASPDDVALLGDLFQGNLTMNINGQDTEVTVIIKRENVDGKTNTGDENGNEMTIYLTTEELERPSWLGTYTAVVYATVFTSNNDGEVWYQLGDMYRGTATIKGYDGNYFGEGSFDTDTWKTNGNTGITNNQTIESVIGKL